MRILIVEDESKLADLISTRLKHENYLVDIASDGEDGLYQALVNAYDLIILDVMLPKKDGFKVLEELRAHNKNTKVIILTAKSSLHDKLTGFEFGADDFLTKPFHLEELVARINAKLRKTNRQSHTLCFADLSLNLKNSMLTCLTTNRETELVRKEFFILECLLKSPCEIISRQFLYDNVWGMESDFISNNLEAYLSFIRKKLKSLGSTVTIKAVRGLGYKLEDKS